jgi:DNA-binding PadR family transcriptional regulator
VALKRHWYHILLALAEGPTHGAEIRRRVARHTQGSLELYPAMLYGSLEDLLERAWIAEVADGTARPADAGDRSRCLALTPAGREILVEATEEFGQVVQIARSLLAGEASP